jgi:hypothetical protein
MKRHQLGFICWRNTRSVRSEGSVELQESKTFCIYRGSQVKGEPSLHIENRLLGWAYFQKNNLQKDTKEILGLDTSIQRLSRFVESLARCVPTTSPPSLVGPESKPTIGTHLAKWEPIYRLRITGEIGQRCQKLANASPKAVPISWRGSWPRASFS